jgi:hypothetical protein
MKYLIFIITVIFITGCGPISIDWPEYPHFNYTPPDPPQLLTPRNTDTNVSLTPELSWIMPLITLGAYVQVADYSSYQNIIFDTLTYDTSLIIPEFVLKPDTYYYWRVSNIGFGELSTWSLTFWFKTKRGI